MTYEDAIDKLIDEGINPTVVTKNKEVQCLEVYSSSLSSDGKIGFIKDLLGDEVRIDFLPNLELIEIKIK